MADPGLPGRSCSRRTDALGFPESSCSRCKADPGSPGRFCSHCTDVLGIPESSCRHCKADPGFPESSRSHRKEVLGFPEGSCRRCTEILGFPEGSCSHCTDVLGFPESSCSHCKPSEFSELALRGRFEGFSRRHVDGPAVDDQDRARNLSAPRRTRRTAASSRFPDIRVRSRISRRVSPSSR